MGIRNDAYLGVEAALWQAWISAQFVTELSTLLQRIMYTTL